LSKMTPNGEYLEYAFGLTSPSFREIKGASEKQTHRYPPRILSPLPASRLSSTIRHRRSYASSRLPAEVKCTSLGEMSGRGITLSPNVVLTGAGHDIPGNSAPHHRVRLKTGLSVILVSGHSVRTSLG
jgi:hypothetical protein